jgi:hypothetical protein
MVTAKYQSRLLCQAMVAGKDGCDCPICKFGQGDFSKENLMDVIQVMDEILVVLENFKQDSAASNDMVMELLGDIAAKYCSAPEMKGEDHGKKT